jgi:hypothetical protein
MGVPALEINGRRPTGVWSVAGKNHSMRSRFILFAVSLSLVGIVAPAPAGGSEGAAIRNPYYEKTEWKVWRDDATPVPDIQNVTGKEKKEQIVTVTVQPPSAATRLYPMVLGRKASAIAVWQPSKTSKRFAGCWDDVYTSWSGLHGYVRNRWMAPDGTKIDGVRDQIIHFVGAKERHTHKLGVNFVHKSTTGMGHTIVNDVQKGTAESYEKLYFGSTLLTSPCHISFSEDFEGQTKDLYLGLNPTIFNSIGSSNSETMAITKMIIAGAYLDPALKALIKRQGLYASTMLFLWKAALPFDVPFDHELKQRIGYKAVGNRHTYPEKYGAAGINRGDRCLVYHQYDDAAHVRNMIALASELDGPLPEAICTLDTLEGGTNRYDLKKSICVVQEAGQNVTLTVSAAKSYDLRDRPLHYRWTVLYGNRATTVTVGEKGDSAVIRVPWDDTLPEGRTVIALTANNGATDGNPAMISVFRKKLADLPPSGGGYKDYVYDMTHVNRRPVVTGLSDQVVRPGKTITLELGAVDPEGQPVRWYKRPGQPGELDGNVFTWKVPRRMPPGAHTVSFIASDGTAGNSYAGRTVSFHVGAPKTMPRVTVDQAWGAAPLKVKCTTKGSVAPGGAFGWEVYKAADKHKAKPFKEQKQGGAFAHTFTEPGRWVIACTLKGHKGVIKQHVWVAATDTNDAQAAVAPLSVESNQLWLTNGQTTRSVVDHTDFGTADTGRKAAPVVRKFWCYNRSDKDLRMKGKSSVSLSGPGAKQFKVVKQPRAKIGAGGSSTFRVQFQPTVAGDAAATVTVRHGAKTFAFAITGRGR